MTRDIIGSKTSPREYEEEVFLTTKVRRSRFAHVFPKASVEAALVTETYALAVVGARGGAVDSKAGWGADIPHSGAVSWFGPWIVS